MSEKQEVPTSPPTDSNSTTGMKASNAKSHSSEGQKKNKNEIEGHQNGQLTAHQQPVNFGTDSADADGTGENSYPSTRRVTIGGVHSNASSSATPNNQSFNNNMSLPNNANSANSLGGLNGPGGFGNGSLIDRRGSLTSLGMDDFFNNIGGLQSRRGSMAGFDGLGVDSFFGPMGLRRDSMDSTTAFMDLHRRRYSMGLPPFPQDNAGLPSLTSGGNGVTNTGAGSFNNNAGLGANTNQDSIGAAGVQRSPGNTPHESLAARQALLQAQQRELERKQKLLELERQRLVDTMRQKNSYGMNGSSGVNNLSNDRRLLEIESMNLNRRPSFPYTSGEGIMSANGVIGATSAHSHLTSVSLDQSGRTHASQHSYYLQPGMDNSIGSQGPNAHRGGSSGGSRNWHICQFCNSKAFASLEEAMAHENICLDNPGRSGYFGGGNGNIHHPHPGGSYFGAHQGSHSFRDNMMHPPLYHPNDAPGRNFSLGLDTSQRSTMSLGIGGSINGGMDGPMGRGLSIGMGSIGMDVSQRSALSMSTGMDVSQRSNLSLDGSNHSFIESALSNGPFTTLRRPMPLAMDCDKDWLTPLHCFVRRHCVEVFTATDDDVATPSKGKRKPIHVGQIGIRCPHCHRSGVNSNSSKARERGSVYYPTTIKSIYNATMNLLQRHLHSCPVVPEEIMRRYETLKADDARSGTSKRYWEESALSLGLVDTLNGIRFSALRPPPLPTLTLQQESTGQSVARRNSNEFFSTKSNAMSDMRAEGVDVGPSNDSKSRLSTSNDFDESDTMSKAERAMADSAPLVTPEDKPYSTLFSYHLLGQMQPCVFTEADRLGKRKGLPPGFPGLACRHCFGGYGSGRFFPSSIKTLSDTSKTLNVLHNHMMRCRKCPAEVRERLDKLRGSHDEERAKMKFGSQKAFFARIWERLHGKGFPGSLKRPSSQQSNRSRDPQQQRLQNEILRERDQQHQMLRNKMKLEDDSRHQHHQLLSEQRDLSPKGNRARSPSKNTPQRSPRPMMNQNHPMHSVGGNGGLDTLAAASSPSKRQKIH